ncbi:MAG: hypothetical protein WB557_06620, partial [Solirubrobacteraceae bacterium]
MSTTWAVFLAASNLICHAQCRKFARANSPGAIDIGKRQTTRKRHVDVGLRVADYPTIQDYIGEAVMDTNAA